MNRRGILMGAAAFLVTACTKIGQTEPVTTLLKSTEGWNKWAQRLFGGRTALAREFDPGAISPFFRGNGTQDPDTPEYRAHVGTNFEDWRLEVRGLVAAPLSLSLKDIRALEQRTQITRHDCVEGWSAIGQWTGPVLGDVLRAAGIQDQARYVVFRCADTLAGGDYYESIDMIDAFHPQTIIAHSLNGAPLPIRNGAPLRMRIERQLGYKHPKYLTAIEAVSSLGSIAGGNGGYWEDRAGYQWYAGI
ncbi:molybdopterin-binding protein [Altererythrobacter aquiaggeris]|uniref:molybdopterin-binding protein n=1 Tax=Aestuarierythrobacter aquiaggeris TaxID=1898396 RepID=UPI003018E5FB